MNWSDEKLSAFLDGELPETEAQALRDAIEQDEHLTDRLAALAAADAVVANTYRPIDDKPWPSSVQKLLAPENGLRFGRPRTTTTGWSRAAVAAGIALLVGLVAGQRWGGSEADWQAIAAVLENRPSGQAYAVSDHTEVEPRLTYRDQRGDYCRHFVVTRQGTTEETIACRRDDAWQPVTTVYRERSGDAGPYRAASGGSPLDSLIDRTLREGPLDRAGEQAAIRRDWRDSGSDETHRR